MLTYPKILSFIIFVPLVISAATLTPYNYDTNEDFVQYSKLAVYMTQRFISPQTNTLIIVEKCEIICRGDLKHHSVLLRKFLYYLNDTLSIQLFVGKQGDRPYDYNLFIVDSYLAFQSLRYRFPITEHERLFYFFILLTWSPNNQEECYRIMYRIFDLCFYFSVRNVVIMAMSATNNTIHFYTYQSFSKGHCHEEITIEEINRYEKGKLRSQFLFPHHISNFYGCTLNVTAHVSEPLLTFDGDMNNQTHLMDMKRLDGIEGKILKLVAKELNFKYRLHFPREANRVGYFHNSTGCFGDLEQNRAQLAIGALSAVIPNSLRFSSSFPYHTTSYVFVVRSGVSFGPIKQLLNPLSRNMWILLVITFVISTIIIKMLEHSHKPSIRNLIFGSDNKNPGRYMCVILLGNPVPSGIISKRNFARFLLMSWLLVTFEIRNGYQGKMFDSLRFSKRIPVPHKISELIDLDYTLVTPMYRTFYPRNKTFLVDDMIKRFELLQSTEMRITTTAMLDYLADYNYKNYNTSSLTYVDEAVFTYSCVMYFHKHSMLRESIDRILEKLSNAGITSYIAKQYIHSRFLNMNMQSKFEFKLSLGNLRGLCYIILIMYIISIHIFIMEMCTRKFETLRKIMDRLNSN